MNAWQEGLQVTEVTFDSEARHFTVFGTSEKQISLEELKEAPDALIEYLIGTDDTLPLRNVRTGFASLEMRPISLPAFEGLLHVAEDVPALLTKAQEASRLVLVEMLGEEAVAEHQPNSHSFGSFQGYTTESGYPIFHVPGNCTQVFVDPEGHVFDRSEGGGYRDWNFHNADTDAQLTSLWAALGCLSRETMLD